MHILSDNVGLCNELCLKFHVTQHDSDLYSSLYKPSLILNPLQLKTDRYQFCGGIHIYRVAQKKMSHRTKCNFSATNRDFSSKLSGFAGERFFNNPYNFTENFHWFKITAI